MLTQHGGDALNGIGWSFDSDQQRRDCAVRCRRSGRLDLALLPALTVSGPSTQTLQTRLLQKTIAQVVTALPWLALSAPYK